MRSSAKDYKKVERHQKILRDENRRLLKELCPKYIHDDLFELLSNEDVKVISSSSTEASVCSDNRRFRNTNTEIENRSDNEEDAGYKSGPSDISEHTPSDNKTQNNPSSNQINLPSEKQELPRKSTAKSRRPVSASRIPNKIKDISPFHKRCKPIEPNRHFIALPFPSNIYQSSNMKFTGEQPVI